MLPQRLQGVSHLGATQGTLSKMTSSRTEGERVWKRCIWNLQSATVCYIMERRQTLRSTDLLYLRNLIRQHLEALLLRLLLLFVYLEVTLQWEGRPGCQAFYRTPESKEWG